VVLTSVDLGASGNSRPEQTKLLVNVVNGTHKVYQGNLSVAVYASRHEDENGLQQTEHDDTWLCLTWTENADQILRLFGVKISISIHGD
jgi:hypothetical protein